MDKYQLSKRQNDWLWSCMDQRKFPMELKKCLLTSINDITNIITRRIANKPFFVHTDFSVSAIIRHQNTRIIVIVIPIWRNFIPPSIQVSYINLGKCNVSDTRRCNSYLDYNLFILIWNLKLFGYFSVKDMFPSLIRI